MPIPQARDVDVTRKQLTTWLARKLPHATDASPSARSVSRAAAASRNETLLIDASWRERDASGERAAWSRASAGPPTRSSPNTISIGSTAAWSSSRRPRSRCRACAGTREDASVLGQPFYVMDRVDGVIPPDHPPFTPRRLALRRDARRAAYARALGARRARQAPPPRLARARLRVPGPPECGTTPFAQQLAYLPP